MKNLMETKSRKKSWSKSKVYFNFKPINKGWTVAMQRFLVNLKFSHPDISVVFYRGMNLISDFYCGSCKTEFSCKPNSIKGYHVCNNKETEGVL